MRCKQILTILLCCFLLIHPSIHSFAASPVYETSEPYHNSRFYSNLEQVPITDNQISTLINVALSQMGYHEGNNNTETDGSNPYGNQDYTEYGYWYGMEVQHTAPYHSPWCAFFVSWCARQAEIPLSIINNSSYARVGTASCYFHLEYRPTNEYFPKTGDIIFYDYSGTGLNWHHTGIVAYVENGYVYTLEGNTSTQAKICKHIWNHPSIRGYGIPQYTNGDILCLNLDQYKQPDKTLRKGNNGQMVKWMQCALVHLGYPVAITGTFDEQTERQILAFQENYNIETSGICGPITQNKVISLLTDKGIIPLSFSNLPVPQRELAYGQEGNEVKWLQTALKKMGFAFNVTGYYSDNTQLAVRMVQRTYHLPETGVCDTATINAIANRIGITEAIVLQHLIPTTTTSPRPTNTPQPTAIPTVTPTATPTPTPTATPVPTNTPAPTPTPTPKPPISTDVNNPELYPVPTRTLRYGCEGEDVKWVQAALHTFGYRITVCGLYDANTVNKIKDFQTNTNLESDGICGPRTRATIITMMADTANTNPIVTPMPQPTTTPTVTPTIAPTPTPIPTSTPEPTPSATTSPITYPVPTRTLRYGYKGNDVKWLQAALTLLGYPVNVVGNYGPKTLASVTDFQVSHHLTVDGICGPQTRTAIIELLDILYNPTPTPSQATDNYLPVPTKTLQKGARCDEVKWLQTNLNVQWASLPITGYYGNQTFAAVKAMQKYLNLPQTDIFDYSTKEAMIQYLRENNLLQKTHPLDTYPIPESTLQQGSTGDSVKWLQTNLKSIGLYMPITGKYASITTQNVKTIQELLGLPITGIFDSVTRAALLAYTHQ